MNAIIRPEHYVLPVKHPANCQCSEHGSKLSGQAGVQAHSIAGRDQISRGLHHEAYRVAQQLIRARLQLQGMNCHNFCSEQ